MTHLHGSLACVYPEGECPDPPERGERRPHVYLVWAWEDGDDDEHLRALFSTPDLAERYAGSRGRRKWEALKKRAGQPIPRVGYKLEDGSIVPQYDEDPGTWEDWRARHIGVRIEEVEVLDALPEERAEPLPQPRVPGIEVEFLDGRRRRISGQPSGQDGSGGIENA